MKPLTYLCAAVAVAGAITVAQAESVFYETVPNSLSRPAKFPLDYQGIEQRLPDSTMSVYQDGRVKHISFSDHRVITADLTNIVDNVWGRNTGEADRISYPID